MDCIYQIPKSDLIHIKTYFEEFRKELPINGKLPQPQDDIRTLINFTGDDKAYAELEDSISVSNLSQNDDITVSKLDETSYRRKSIIEIPKKALRLRTFRELLKIRKESQERNCFGKSILSYKKVTRVPNTNETPSDLEPYSDVVISVRLYRPFRFEQGSGGNDPRFAEEFLVLGTNKLTQFRDKISCICNNRQFFDISNDPYQDLSPAGTNPGFIFVTDTFYNDTRIPNNSDYSKVIRDWLKAKEQFKDNEYKSALMENTTFMDLSIQLGFPQVYMHHGNCEHLFTFSSIQLISPQCNLHRNDYPILNTTSFPKAVLCHICASRVYTFIVKNSDRQFYDPTYLCRVCFETYYYIDRKKAGNFEAYQLNPDDMIDPIPVDEEEKSDDDDDDDDDNDDDDEESCSTADS